MVTKSSLRKKAVETRLTLPDHASRNRAIANRLEAYDVYRESGDVYAYVSMSEEVDTHTIIERAIRLGRSVFAPRVITNSSLEWVQIDSIDALHPGAFGVLEPVGPASSKATADGAVALVPGVAFDREGFRLGWGKGYYDRFLSTFNGRTIALAFDCQIYDAVPVEAHDQPVEFLVTESEIFTATQR